MPSNYDRGRRHEDRAVQDLRKAGYVARRTAGSHGPWDVTAVDYENVRLIQVKAQGEPLAEARSLLQSIHAPPCVSLEIWTRVRGGWQIEVVHGAYSPTFTV